jgi:hypothetical protein
MTLARQRRHEPLAERTAEQRQLDPPGRGAKGANKRQRQHRKSLANVEIGQ